jgi:hypothetical protein
MPLLQCAASRELPTNHRVALGSLLALNVRLMDFTKSCNSLSTRHCLEALVQLQKELRECSARSKDQVANTC